MSDFISRKFDLYQTPAKQMWSLIIIFSFQCRAFFLCPIVYVSSKPLSLNPQQWRAQLANTEEKRRKYKTWFQGSPTSANPATTLSAAVSPNIDRSIDHLKIVPFLFLWSDISWTQMSLLFSWSTGWQGKNEGRKGELGPFLSFLVLELQRGYLSKWGRISC